MASEAIGELGAIAPSAATWTEVYAVPDVAGDYAVTSLITVCNTGTSTDYFSLGTITHSAGTPSLAQTKVSLVPVPPNSTYLLKVGLTLGRNKALTAYSKYGNLSISAQGVQNV